MVVVVLLLLYLFIFRIFCCCRRCRFFSSVRCAPVFFALCHGLCDGAAATVVDHRHAANFSFVQFFFHLIFSLWHSLPFLLRCRMALVYCEIFLTFARKKRRNPSRDSTSTSRHAITLSNAANNQSKDTRNNLRQKRVKNNRDMDWRCWHWRTRNEKKTLSVFSSDYFLLLCKPPNWLTQNRIGTAIDPPYFIIEYRWHFNHADLNTCHTYSQLQSRDANEYWKIGFSTLSTSTCHFLLVSMFVCW